MAFPIENPIPSEDIIYRSVPLKANPLQWIEIQNRPSSAAFRDPNRRVSVNWHKHKPNPAHSAKPNAVAVVSLFVADCRDCKKDVDHTPIQEGELFGPNQAHSEICDLGGSAMTKTQDAEARDELARRAIPVWRPPEVEES